MRTWKWKYFNISFLIGSILFYVTYFSLSYNYFSYRVLGNHDFEFIVTVFCSLLVSYPLGFVLAILVIRYILKEKISLRPAKS